jgi:hypothetical protein
VAIPDYNGVFDVSGTSIILNATDIKIVSLLSDPSTSGFYVLPDNYLGIHLSKTHLNVSCSYSTLLFGANYNGTAWIYVEDIDIRTSATLLYKNNEPAVDIKGTNITYASF